MIGRIGPKGSEHTVTTTRLKTPKSDQEKAMLEGRKKTGTVSSQAIPGTYDGTGKSHIIVELKGEENYPRGGTSKYPV